jgi:hypothetical protein
MYEHGFFRLLPAAERLLVDLVASSAEGPLLVASYQPLPGPLHVADTRDVVVTSGPVSGQVATIRGAGPYAGAVIIPPFGHSVPAESFISPGDDWHQRPWFAEEYLIAHAWSRLLPGARLVAFVSAGLLNVNRRREARRAMLAHGLRLVAHVPNEVLWEPEHNAQTYLALLERQAEPARRVAVVHMNDASEVPPAAAFDAWLGGNSHPGVEARLALVSQDECGDDIRLDPAYHDPSHLELQPPPGYEEYPLGDIAKIIAGVRADAAERLAERPDGGIPYVQVRHLRADGTLDDQPYWLAPRSSTVVSHGEKRAMPGDILVSTAGTIGKVALIGAEYGSGVLFDTSIRRLRIVDDNVSPQTVAEFLRSDLGQMQFHRLTIGSVIPHLASPQLAQLRVFLPAATPDVGVAASAPTPVAEQPRALSPEEIFARTLENEMRSIVDQISRSKPDEWRQSVADRLRQIASDIAPRPLPERIRQTFPAPLAIAYRRYEMARHNPYEQLDRMINLVEACTYFAFHTLLADCGQAEWRNKIALPKPAREALKPRATFDHRIQFIRTLRALAREHRLDLFVPELVECNIDEYADEFRLQLRNPVAHSAPGSEAYVAELVQRHQHRLHELLGQLDFLADYTMCRVRGHYFQQARWHYQCELYRGEEYDVNLQEIPLMDAEVNGRLIAADRNHLVLLSPEYEVLDLWPYYQLHFSDVTCRESHLCFVKHFTSSDKTLHGESIRSGVELELSGFEDYYRPPAVPQSSS